MKRLYPHRRWLAALVAAFALLIGGDPLLRMAHGGLNARLQKLEDETRDLTQALDQLHKDAETAEKLSRSMKADEMEAYLAPVDRLKITAQFEPLARAAHMGKFTYTLLPERPLKHDYALADAEGLVESSLTFDAEAPHDAAVYRFIDRLMRQLPGRAQLRSLTLDRMSMDDKAPLSPLNVRASAEIDWIANKSVTAEAR